MSYCVRLHPEEQNVVLAGTQEKKIMQWDLDTGDMVQVGGRGVEGGGRDRGGGEGGRGRERARLPAAAVSRLGVRSAAHCHPTAGGHECFASHKCSPATTPSQTFSHC